MNRVDVRVPAIVAMVFALMTATSAVAEADREVSVFPLTPTGLLPDQADLPDALSSELARELNAKLSKTAIEDAALALDCQVDSESCLSTISERADTKTIVYGAVIWNDMTRKLKVVLTKFDARRGKTVRSWVLDSATSADAVPELMSRAEGFIDEITGRSSERVKPKPRCDEEPAAPDCVPTVPVGGGGDGRPETQSGVTTGTYALIVGGAVATAVGIGFRVSAQSIRSEAGDTVPRTPDEIAAFRDLEARGTLHTNIGNALMIGGAAAITYGIVRALGQRKPAVTSSTVDPPTGEETDSELTVSPLPGGAALVFTARFL